MEVTGGEEEGFIREWTPCTHMLNLISPRVQNGLFSTELYLTCIDAVTEYVALGTNLGLVYWYDRKKGNIQRLRCEVTSSAITYVKIVNTVDFMVGAGNSAGQVTVFQIPKEHPENIPEALKPKVEPKVERYTIGDLHKSPITSIEWSKNGMRLFSGDKNGVIIMTEIDFYMHLCKSMEIVNEEHEIVQMSYWQSSLLVSSMYRTILCERSAGDATWKVNQVGKKERKSLCRLGAVWQHSYARGGSAAAYCARGGLRLWRADHTGHVHQTLLFKEAISNPLTVAELLNPSRKPRVLTHQERNFGPLYVFREHFIVTHDEDVLYVLDPRSLTAVAVVDDLRRILSVCVNKDEILVLEGPRSVVRLAHAPDTALTEEPTNLMTKSLTTSIQQAVNTVRDLTHIDQTVPFISSVLDPIAIFTKDRDLAPDHVPRGEECFELPPIKNLPNDISGKVLESIINEFKDVTDPEEARKARSEELEKKLKMYSNIMSKQYEGELIHSRKSRRRDGSATRRDSSSSRHSTPVRRSCTPGAASEGVAYTTPCLMSVSVYSNMVDDSDDKTLEKQIEEKEKILAKMLNLESLSITSVSREQNHDEVENLPNTLTNSISYVNSSKDNTPPLHERKNINYSHETSPKKVTEAPPKNTVNSPKFKPQETQKKNVVNADLVPKLAKIPNNWHLENIELKFDYTSDEIIDQPTSPDDTLDSEWEIV